MGERNILVIAAHSDDEALGCSGTLLKHVTQGDAVHLLFMADGTSSRVGKSSKIESRFAIAQEAAKILGVNSIENLNFPDNKMDSVPLLDIVREIENRVDKIRPEIIYTHHIGDLNIDHQVTHKAVITACRPQPESCVKELYAFEILSSTEWQTPAHLPFTPNVFIDITDYIDIKKQVLEVYSEEMRQSPHSRSIDNTIRLSSLRGSTVGVIYAEAFELIRSIQ